MIRYTALVALGGVLLICSCTKKETAQAPAQQAPAAAAQPGTGPHVFVHLKDGSKVPGVIVASSQNDMTVAGDDGIERKIPTAQIKNVEYGVPAPTQPAKAASRQAARSDAPAATGQQAAQTSAPAPQQQAEQSSTPPPPPPVTTRTYVLPAGTELSVRTNETIDSAKAAEGQTFDAQLTRSAKDADGEVVIPRGARANVVIKSASKGGRFRGASDLVLDLQSVVIDGKVYAVDTSDVVQKGRSGIGANKRTAEMTGGGAALGAIIGAIAGGGRGAAIGAGAGAGAGALTQVVTKGGAIKVPAETVLTFKLDRALKVVAQ